MAYIKKKLTDYHSTRR